MPQVGLRVARAEDSEVCYRLHRAAMGPYVTAIWGWDDEVQRAYHARLYTPDVWRIITVAGTDAGLLVVEYRPAEVYLGRLALHPRHQGRGIGSRFVRALLTEARRRGQDLVLDVLAVNERAHALYLRFGLHDVARHGPGDIKIRMRSGSTGPKRPPAV